MLRRAHGLSLALVASVCAVGAEAKECKLEEAIQAETEASSLQTWAEVFESFVLRHLDETMSVDQYKVIRENVQHHCPATAMKLCAAIQVKLDDDEAG